MNEGIDVYTLDARDPPARRARARRGLRPGRLERAVDLGDLRGLVPPALDARALRRRRPNAVRPEIVALAGGPDAIVAAADRRLDAARSARPRCSCASSRSRPTPGHRGALETFVAAHEQLLVRATHGRELLARPGGSTTRSPTARQRRSNREHRHRRRHASTRLVDARRRPRPGSTISATPRWRDGLDALLDVRRTRDADLERRRPDDPADVDRTSGWSTSRSASSTGCATTPRSAMRRSAGPSS